MICQPLKKVFPTFRQHCDRIERRNPHHHRQRRRNPVAMIATTSPTVPIPWKTLLRTTERQRRLRQSRSGSEFSVGDPANLSMFYCGAGESLMGLPGFAGVRLGKGFFGQNLALTGSIVYNLNDIFSFGSACCCQWHPHF